MLIDFETSARRTNMATSYWDSWTGFPANQRGWFWGAEKQAAIGSIAQWEDYKGLIDELRFWSRAKSAAEIAVGYDDPVVGNESGLVGWYAFDEGQGTSLCDTLQPTRCMTLYRGFNGRVVDGGGFTAGDSVEDRRHHRGRFGDGRVGLVALRI